MKEIGKHWLLTMACLVCSLCSWAQNDSLWVLNGRVEDAKTHKAIASVSIMSNRVGTVTNADGEFVLKLSDEVTVTAFDSTDLGVSFLVDFLGVRFFHAGDLNFWHWREESSMQEIDEADQEFRKAVRPIAQEKIDVAFFPVDPRQGTMFEAGANYFILSVKPRILIPMHYFHRADAATEYARTASCRTTEVLCLPGYGDQVRIEADEEHYLNLSFPEVRLLKPGGPDEDPGTDKESLLNATAEGEKPLESGDTILSEDDPFIESDLPLTSLADRDPEKENEQPG